MERWNMGSNQNSLRALIEEETKKLDMSQWVEQKKKEKEPGQVPSRSNLSSLPGVSY